ncbi:MAG TPA: SseB family protein, partial [Trebonia sp.]|nr:SseB family protein [Trebonia sp.]
MLPIDPAGDGQRSPPIVSPYAVPPQAIAYGGTIIRPGAVAWGGIRDAVDPDGGRAGGRGPSEPSCEAVERALAATLGNPGALPGLIGELAAVRLWVPLPVRGRRFTDGTAVRLPVIGYSGDDFVPCFTSVQRLTAWTEADPGRTGEQRRAGDTRTAPHIVLPATGLARRLPYGLGLAVNPDSVPGLPLYPECVSFLARLAEPRPLAMERAVDVAGVRFLIGHPPTEPAALLAEARAALAAQPAVREASRAWLSFPGGGEGLLIAAV